MTSPKSWLDKRVAKQAKLILNYNILSRFLSQRIESPLVLATRGNTGVGKSFWIHHFTQKYVNENSQLIEGVLNPDTVKGNLKKGTDKILLNSQVYVEGRIVFERFLEHLTKKINAITSAIIDTRLLTIGEFEQILAVARLRQASVELIDVEAPIWNSIFSVLSRKPLGKDPCVPFWVIKDGFIRARKYRKEFIHLSLEHRVNYSLYQLNKEGKFILVAQCKNNQFESHDKAFEECLKTPVETELDEIGQTVITDELIEQHIHLNSKAHVLTSWRTYTIAEALQKHANGEEPN